MNARVKVFNESFNFDKARFLSQNINLPREKSKKMPFYSRRATKVNVLNLDDKLARRTPNIKHPATPNNMVPMLAKSITRCRSQFYKSGEKAESPDSMVL